jgi:hypothetical protein
LFEVVARKPILSRVEQDSPGDEVSVECGVELFEIIDPPRFQDPGNFSQSRAPINHMMQDPKAEDRIHGLRVQGEVEGISHEKAHPLFSPGGQIVLRLPDHPDIQVQRVNPRELKHLEDQMGSGTTAAAHLEGDSAWLERAHPFEPPDFEPLFHYPERVIHGPALRPVQFHCDGLTF